MQAVTSWATWLTVSFLIGVLTTLLVNEPPKPIVITQIVEVSMKPLPRVIPEWERLERWKAPGKKKIRNIQRN